MNDQELMRKALQMAKKGWGLTSPNPIVGAIIVKNGEIVGQGYHAKAGDAHAEINAIRDAGKQADGADLYITLEPCSTHGRTPPCTEAIKNAGIKRVFIGALDPNPRHSGIALLILHEAGVQVFDNILREECENVNEAFFKWIATGKPFVLLKQAMTLDGKIATQSGVSQWITGPEARERVQWLRQWADAIMVGAGTARLDRPSLKVRNPENWPRQPRRIVVSRSMTVPEATEILDQG
ncbi:MAG: bifunctional diaminohydroxyphosphoribosylaminopyrimidine deaminase/5-amino-6-(5-phosphoribosylamino)uracil reductase RibD, partial [Victivallaceae bacterium]|nr:bifunctional diaminohydroxyphosphoribosylaminopyrimidine deaminase/5-amino-6-(5-phosphoribosylamino)uracil reductase RibD [Victivallaceae bacterium]